MYRKVHHILAVEELQNKTVAANKRKKASILEQRSGLNWQLKFSFHPSHANSCCNSLLTLKSIRMFNCINSGRNRSTNYDIVNCIAIVKAEALSNLNLNLGPRVSAQTTRQRDTKLRNDCSLASSAHLHVSL